VAPRAVPVGKVQTELLRQGAFLRAGGVMGKETMRFGRR
jgi:hypothetical protein